ncbi:hypothetical protein CANARDRAFT_27068 [[Candida] arabinofermentans NRRL YB-2248]|uniref:Uncharacterized protein n=1 Tax=[Candida] arabinofermentans NRRL YB-2248 TaxID=983967 RepID=A0A1E4T4J0_9ASCO|nr:hypothetical protein CANARDRAFT_27068 [[Candida] arabinofermentans NRRL YB-2248]
MNKGLNGSHLNSLKNIHNSYVMDFCNIIWRDKAFEKNSKSKSIGFMIPDSFINKLMKQRYYRISVNGQDTEIQSPQDLNLKSNFNLFYSPPFTSIITDIIRDLEDEENVEIRLIGPLNEKSFTELIKSEDRWLDEYTYDSLRIKILNELYNKGYKGVNLLLFSSLRSLNK